TVGRTGIVSFSCRGRSGGAVVSPAPPAPGTDPTDPPRPSAPAAPYRPLNDGAGGAFPVGRCAAGSMGRSALLVIDLQQDVLRVVAEAAAEEVDPAYMLGVGIDAKAHPYVRLLGEGEIVQAHVRDQSAVEP